MNSPVKDCLVVLNRHADVIEMGLEAGQELSPETGVSAPAIAALRQALALRPSGEDGYRLHPRLREYLQDLMQIFPAYQTLAEIGSKVVQLSSLWTEIDDVRRSGERGMMEPLIEQLETTVDEIRYAVDRNIVMLQSRLSTRYGNVASLSAKQRQNRWYQRQTSQLSNDLGRLAVLAERLERDTGTRGMKGLSSYLRRNLVALLLPWQESINEMQSLIRKELFRTHQLQEDLRRLGQMDDMLRQQPAWKGIEVDLPEEIPDFLLAAALPAFRPHAEPLDGDQDVAEAMEALARELPAERVKELPPVLAKQTIIRDDAAAAAPPIVPADRALLKLFRHITSTTEEVSVLRWRETDADAQTLPANVWLVFAVSALRADKHLLAILEDPPRPGERFSHTFFDALVLNTGGSRKPMEK